MPFSKKISGLMRGCVPAVLAICASQVSYAWEYHDTSTFVIYLARNGKGNFTIVCKTKDDAKFYEKDGEIIDENGLIVKKETIEEVKNDVKYVYDDVKKNLTIGGSGVLSGVWKDKLGEFVDFYGVNRKKYVLVTKVIFEEESKIIGIADNTFSGCALLKELDIPGTSKFIGDKAFFLCKSLERVSIRYGVSCIGKYAFGDCYELKKFSIPTSVKYIGRHILPNSFGNGFYLGIKEIKIVDKDNSSVLVKDINTNIDNIVEKVKISYGIVYYVDPKFDKPQIPINFVIEDVEGEEKIDGYTFNKYEAMGEFLNLDLSKKDISIYSKLISWLCSTNECYFKKNK